MALSLNFREYTTNDFLMCIILSERCLDPKWTSQLRICIYNVFCFNINNYMYQSIKYVNIFCKIMAGSNIYQPFSR